MSIFINGIASCRILFAQPATLSNRRIRHQHFRHRFVCQTVLPMGRFAFKQMRVRFVHKDVEYCQVIQVAVLMRQLDLV